MLGTELEYLKSVVSHY